MSRDADSDTVLLNELSVETLTLLCFVCCQVKSRIVHNVDEKRRQLELVGVDVPQEGQLLMNSIART